MGDGEKAPLRLQFNPKVRLEFRGAAITSDAGPWPSENWMTPWALLKLLPTISRKAVPAATSDTTWSRCSGSPFTAVWPAMMTPTMLNAFLETQPFEWSWDGKAPRGKQPALARWAGSRRNC